jgi:hypothetical protein
MKKTTDRLSIAVSELSGTYTYAQYGQLIDQLLSKDTTTGTNQSAFYIDYTRQNVERMKRAEQLLSLPLKELQQVSKPYQFLVITEAWCGDASYIVPVLAALTKALPSIDLTVVLRDEHLEIMDKFLTNGGRSIPKLILIDPTTHEVMSDWGPRPKKAQEMVEEMKQRPDFNQKEMSTALFAWYEADKGESIVKEILQIMKELE